MKEGSFPEWSKSFHGGDSQVPLDRRVGGPLRPFRITFHAHLGAGRKGWTGALAAKLRHQRRYGCVKSDSLNHWWPGNIRVFFWVEHCRPYYVSSFLAQEHFSVVFFRHLRKLAGGIINHPQPTWFVIKFKHTIFIVKDLLLIFRCK